MTVNPENDAHYCKNGIRMYMTYVARHVEESDYSDYTYAHTYL